MGVHSEAVSRQCVIAHGIGACGDHAEGDVGGESFRISPDHQRAPSVKVAEHKSLRLTPASCGDATSEDGACSEPTTKRACLGVSRPVATLGTKTRISGNDGVKSPSRQKAVKIETMVW